MIFDGLDELLDTGYRREISEDVESFANLYPSTPILVTSRSVGYDEAPLDVNEFEVYYLSELTSEQVTEYVGKWFSLDDELSSEEQRDLAECFIAESEVVADLRNNPLMLALMCNIYKGENYIPANRPDVYEKCALMLFERWDRARNIRYGLPFESHVRPAMMHLAYQIYTDPFLQAGVTRSALEKMATSYLLEKRFDDEEEASSAARKFVDFCTGRAWVFTDVGTTPAGEALYQFTHRTFLEYFTAGHLVRLHPTPDRLLPVLGPRVAGVEWDVVAQLAVQMQDKTAESAGEKVLRGLLNAQWPGRSRYNVLSFCARCLQFLVPSSRVVREVAEAVIADTISCLEALDWESQRSSEQPQDCGIALGELLLASSENHAAVRSVVLSAIQRGLAEDRIGAGDLVWNLPFAFHVVGGALGSARRAEWEDIIERFRSEFTPQLVNLARRDLPQAVAAVRNGAMNIDDGLNAHGIELLLVNSPVRLIGAYFISMGEELLHQLAWPTPQGDDDRIIRMARDLGTVLSDMPHAWVVGRRRVGRPAGLFPARVLPEEVSCAPLDGLALEGAGLLLACLVSLSEHVGDGANTWDANMTWGRLQLLTGLLRTRSGDSIDVTLREELRGSGMRQASVGCLIQWAERRRELIVVQK